VCRADAGVAVAGYWGSHKISKAMIEMLRTSILATAFRYDSRARRWSASS
jgi:Ser/Thr protein kinase RdoA (MazF antagonist)